MGKQGERRSRKREYTKRLSWRSRKKIESAAKEVKIQMLKFFGGAEENALKSTVEIVTQLRLLKTIGELHDMNPSSLKLLYLKSKLKFEELIY